jgi:hypothetical protein
MMVGMLPIASSEQDECSPQFMLASGAVEWAIGNDQ